MAERVCVTGAAGFIGSHLVARLKADGHFVRAVDIQHHDERRDLYDQADEVVICDLRNPENWWALKGHGRVYHLAADHGGAGYFHSEHDQPAARNNMQIDLNVLRACETYGVERLFYASSFCAYPTECQAVGNVEQLSEDLLYQGEAEQCYGSEKRFMTRLCQDAPFVRCGVFATIYGPYQEAEGIRAKFPTAITHRALHASGPVELWGDGTQIRTFLYIDDAIDRIVKVMDSDRYEGPVNVASDEPVTVLDCAKWACEFAGAEPEFDFRMDMPTGVAVRVPDLSKWKSVYGHSPQLPAREGFRRLSKWMRPEMAKAA